MSQSADSAAAWITGPVGGFAIAVLFYPTGCATTGLVCPDGKQTNLLNSTMGGLVGQVDKVGAFVIGVVAAVVVWLIVDAATSSSA